MVSNNVLAALCVYSGLHRHIVFQSSELAMSFEKYERVIRGKQAEEYALAEKEGRMPGQYWFEVEPPKVCLFTNHLGAC